MLKQPRGMLYVGFPNAIPVAPPIGLVVYFPVVPGDCLYFLVATERLYTHSGKYNFTVSSR